MRFLVRRTSCWDNKTCPCDEAVKETVITFSDCSCKTLSEALKHDWVRRGRPEQKKGFVRVYNEPTKEWCVEIKSLDELLSFYTKYGNIVITSSDSEEVPLLLEIYDDYRE